MKSGLKGLKCEVFERIERFIKANPRKTIKKPIKTEPDTAFTGFFEFTRCTMPIFYGANNSGFYKNNVPCLQRIVSM